ncbi:MAG: hypothetical protein AAF713_12665 [Pseudomonadota bacterium]
MPQSAARPAPREEAAAEVAETVLLRRSDAPPLRIKAALVSREAPADAGISISLFLRQTKGWAIHVELSREGLGGPNLSSACSVQTLHDAMEAVEGIDPLAGLPPLGTAESSVEAIVSMAAMAQRRHRFRLDFEDAAGRAMMDWTLRASGCA